ncbi:hypothetical protein [Nostoc sp.]|uniref:hypothetical protein n=1 Tax=Nostoc sp. TaxID=1180 RepID=UPI002FF4BB87
MGSGEWGNGGDEEAEISNFSEQEKQIFVIQSFKGATPRFKGATPKLKGATPRFKGATSKLKGATSKLKGATPKLKGATSRLKGSTVIFQKLFASLLASAF